jgi:hypothetical protein
MHAPALSILVSVLLSPRIAGLAQLADSTQITPTVPGGQIAKSLEQQVGAGHGDELTPGSSVYLIKREPPRSICRGRQVGRPDQPDQPRLTDARAARPASAATWSRAPTAATRRTCSASASKEMLADEITADLRAIRARAARRRRRTHRQALPARLVAKDGAE